HQRPGERMASLAGRASEVAAVEQAIEAVASGQVRVVLVTGEPGIGKSRLLTEASARADATGFRVLSGYAAEGPWQQPLAPLRMAFASIAPNADAAGAIDITE